MKCLSLIVAVVALAFSGCTDQPNTSRNALAFNQNAGPAGFNPGMVPQQNPQAGAIQRDMQQLQASRQALAGLGVNFEWPFITFHFGDLEDERPEITLSSSLFEYGRLSGLDKQQVPQIRKHLATYANIALNSPAMQNPQMVGLNPIQARKIRLEGLVAQDYAKLLKVRESMEKMFDLEDSVSKFVKITHRRAGLEFRANARLLKSSWDDFDNTTEKTQKDMTATAVSLGEYRNLGRANSEALAGLADAEDLANILAARAEAADEMVLFLLDRTHENVAKLINLDKEILKIRAQTQLDSTEKVSFSESQIELLNSLSSMYQQYEQLADDTVYDEMDMYDQVPRELKGFYRTMVRKKEDAARQVAFIKYRIAESDVVLNLALLDKLGIKFTQTANGEFNWEGPEAGTLSGEDRNEIVSTLRSLRKAIQRMDKFGKESRTTGHAFSLAEMIYGAGNMGAAATDAQNHYSGQ